MLSPEFEDDRQATEEKIEKIPGAAIVPMIVTMEKEEKKNDDDRFVSCVNCEFSWTTDEREKIKDEFRLRDINFHVARGELVGIIGRVGSGKSSLLLSILKSTHKIRGTLSVNMKSSIAYVVFYIILRHFTLFYSYHSIQTQVRTSSTLHF